jgi:WD40 repeat protein
MKVIKFLTVFLTISILAIGLTSTSACSAAEPEAIEEAAEEEQPAVVEEPEIVEEPVETEPIDEPEAEEAEEITAEGHPELVWSYNHENSINSMDVDPDGEILAVGEFKVSYMHILANGDLIDVIIHEHAVEDLEFSLDGAILGAGQGYHGILLTDLDSGEEYMTLEHGHNSRLAFAPDGKHIATGDRNGIIWLWNISDGELLAELEEPEIKDKAIQNQWILDINYHPSGNILSSLHNDYTVYIWDLEKEQVINKIQLDDPAFKFSPTEPIMAGAVREDGKYLVRLWDVDSGNQVGDLSVPGEVLDIAFSPDGKLLSVATFGRPTNDSESAATIYDISTQELLYTLGMNLENNDYPMTTVFTPDGGHLAVGTNGGMIEFWRLPGAEPLEEPEIDIKEPPPLPSDLLFDTGSSTLKTEADPVLEEFAQDLYAALPEAKITFVGHTDSRGDASSNMQLSIDRATAVKDWFENWAQENNADGWNLLVDGKGDTELKVPDVDSEGNFLEGAGSLNRRVEIEIE